MMRARISALAAALALAACAGHEATPAGEVVFTLRAHTWFEDGWSFFDVAPDAAHAVFGARFGRRLFDLRSGREDAHALADSMERVAAALYGPDGALWRRGTHDGVEGWYRSGPDGPEHADLPADAAPSFSADGAQVAYYRGTAGSGPELFVGFGAEPTPVDLDGLVTGVGWAPDASAVYAMVFRDDGTSALYRVTPDGEDARLVRGGLDATARFNALAFSPDGGSVYLSLVGTGPPDPEARHRPDADRDLDLYRLELSDGPLRPVVTEEGDDFRPQIVGGELYWTHNVYHDDVAVLPVEGGVPRDIVADGQIPYWSNDGRRLAYTVGGWKLADWALNMDADVVGMDPATATVVSAARPIVTGYHEDFTPAWSPDGRWIAYHSHRSARPVAHYFASGAADDIWLRRPDAPMSEEIRVTDFGWEVGMADWSPDGTRLVFDSWDRGGPGGVSHPWIATIDPETGRPLKVERLPLPEGFGGTVLESWSPVDDEIAVVQEVADGRHALWVVRADGSGARRVVEYPSATYGGVDWTPDGRRLLYGALADGRMQIFSVDAAGGEPVRLSDGPDDYVHPQVSPDGRWIAVTHMRHDKEVRKIALP